MTLQSQYNQFLHSNPDSTFSFNEWKQWHDNQIKQAIIQMMQDDEELGLYDEPKQETLKEAANRYAEIYRCPATNNNEYCKHDIISAINFGAKWQQERSYSEEEVIDIAKQAFVLGKDFGLIGTFNEWFEQFKKK